MVFVLVEVLPIRMTYHRSSCRQLVVEAMMMELDTNEAVVDVIGHVIQTVIMLMI